MIQHAGLADVIAGSSGISTVGQDGVGLTYRGYSIFDLANKASFEEVAYLLIYGHLPNNLQYTQYCKLLRSLREIPNELKTFLKLIPQNAHPMDVLRSACSFLGLIEQETDFSMQQNIANRLLALFPGILCYWYHIKNNSKFSEQTDETSFASHFLTLLHGKKPSEMQEEMMNVSLILYAEHEFNASTFAARVTAATLSDFYSAITSAIGTLRGSLHGGANEKAMYLMEEIKNNSADPNDAETILLKKLANKEKIMGFGHRVYKNSDPRSDVIKVFAKNLIKTEEDKIFFSLFERIEKVMWREKHLFPNLDFYSALAYYECNIPTLLFTPIFVLSRITGWSAHVIEQRENNRLIRPSSEYTGPKERKFILMSER